MRWFAAVAVLVAALAVPEIARAQVTVNSFTDAAPPGPCTPDQGGCTLREALVSTVDGTIVNLPAGEYHVTEGALPVGGSRFLVGAGARTTTITADFISRVMTVTAGDMSIRDVTISGGNVVEGPGGGIFVSPGTELILFDSTVMDNTAETGGGIYSEGILHVERSTIALNFAEGETPRGGGLAVGEGGDADLLDTTISGNYSDATGAGLYTTGNVEMHNVTIARNTSDGSSPSGGGIQQAFDDDTDVTVAFNTLVVENEGGNCLGTTNDQIQARFSMADDMLCNVPQAPELGNTPIPPNSGGVNDLGNHGGPTDTHELASDSPALGEAEPGTCEGKFDQRGLARELGGACDIGAYERADELTVTTESDQSDNLCTETGCGVREAINLVASEGEVEVPQGNYVLSRGQLTVESEVVVRGVGARVTTLTAGTNSRVLSVSDGGFVTLVGVRVTGGNVAIGQSPLGSIGGGIAVTNAGVSLIDSAVNNNVAGRGGGIFVADGGVLLTDTTVSANQAIDSEIGSGGGLYLDESSGVLVSSTISGNTARTVGGGIMTVGSTLQMASVTLAANGILLGQGSGSAIYRAVILDDTIELGETLAHNTLIAGSSGTACGGAGPFDVTSVMTDNASCPGQLVGDALISDLADNGGDTDTHALMTGSPAIDSGANCGLADQRGESRPQGLACDVGAFEGDGGDPSTLRVTTTVVNNDGGSAEADDFLVHVRRGATDVPGSPQPGSGQGTEYTLPAGDYVVSGDVGGRRYTVAIGGQCASGGGITLPEDVTRNCGVTFDDIAQPPPSGGGGGGGGGAAAQQDPPPLPEPEAGEEVNALPKSGTVKVKVAGTNRFVELEEGQQIPVGSVIDTTKGRVTIVAAGGQSADFYDGIFRLTQGKGTVPLTTLTLVEALSCPNAGNAVAAAKKKKRRLWGDGNGKFRTKGKHSAATVVGTRWLVEDKCTSTTTRVVRGRVSVRDFVKKKTVIVKAGKKYVARARR